MGGSLCAYPGSGRKASCGPMLVIGPAPGSRLRGGLHKAAAAALPSCMKSRGKRLEEKFFPARFLKTQAVSQAFFRQTYGGRGVPRCVDMVSTGCVLSGWRGM